VDGNGKITGGVDDFWGTITGGSYSVTHNGTGTITVNVSTSTGTQTLSWVITLGNPGTTNSPGSFAVIEGDSLANSAGAAYQQNPATLTTAPSGTFVFRTHVSPPGSSLTGAQASVGSIAFNNATVTGNDDWVNGGGVGGQTIGFSGTFTAPSGGVGSVSFTDGLGMRTFDYFVIDANDLLLYETDTLNHKLGLGRAETQQTPTGGFTKSSLSGSFAFLGHGDTSASAAGGVNSVGQFTADGNGNITGGSLDSVRDGTAQLAQTLSASSYLLAATGRLTSTLNTSGGGAVANVTYLVSPTRGFFLVSNDVTLVEDGTVDQQSTSSFTNSSFNGQYAFVLGGVVSTVPQNRTGIITADGNGNLGWFEPVTSSVCSTATYSVAANGRVTATVSVKSVSSSLIFYLISPGLAYVIQGDSGSQVRGGAANQNHLPTPYIPGT
jgi:hypothetical protein